MPHTKKTVSPKQLAANRANAAKSTGPKSQEGKARAAQNAVKHGFAASNFAVVRLEDTQEVANLKADLVALYQPVNAQELFALERMALAQQSILRASRLESGLFTTCMNDTIDGADRPFSPMSSALVGDGDMEVTRAQNRNYCLALGFQRHIRQSNVWSLFLRYQAQAERQYRRALEEFERLKALRAELSNDALPNEPVALAQPEEKPDLYQPFVPDPNSPVQPGPTPVPAGGIFPIAKPAPEHSQPPAL